MKVAYLLGSLNRGGTETMYLDLFRRSNMLPFTIYGIHRKAGAYSSEYYATGALWTQIKPRLPFDLQYLVRLRKYIIKHNINIVHAQQRLDAIYAWLALKGTGTKVIQTLHGHDYYDSKISDLLAKWSICVSILNIFVSKTQYEEYKHKYRFKKLSKMRVIYNGVSFDKLDAKKEGVPLCKRNVGASSLMLGSVGNFTSGRSQIFLCRFLHLLNKEAVDYDFVFVGAKSDTEPWLYEECIQYCQENKIYEKVHFLGSSSDVPNILKQLDAFMYASVHDTFGIAVIEAIAVGVPTFVNDLRVMREITADGKRAILYRNGDERDLLDKFKYFLKNKQKVKINAEKAAADVRERYSIQVFINNLFQVYKSLFKES